MNSAVEDGQTILRLVSNFGSRAVLGVATELEAGARAKDGVAGANARCSIEARRDREGGRLSGGNCNGGNRDDHAGNGHGGNRDYGASGRSGEIDHATETPKTPLRSRGSSHGSRKGKGEDSSELHVGCKVG